MGIFIGMSRKGNGYNFRIKRTNTTVEIDSADAKFNETFSDCRDRQGRIIKGGKVLDPDLINELEKATDLDKAIATWIPSQIKSPTSDKPSRFSTTNRYDNLMEENEQGTNDGNASDRNSDSETDDEMESFERKYKPTTRSKPFEIKNNNLSIDGPIKTQAIKSRDVKNLLPTKGFEEATQRDQSKQFKNVLPSKGSQKAKRKTKPPERLEPNFEPTQKRRETTFFLEDEDDDLTDLEPTVRTYDQLLSCMEQQIKNESGNLKDPEEDLIQKSLHDIGNTDPKSQKAIDKMPEQIRKRYNDATKKEYEGMKSKGVMDFVRISDLPKNAKI
jgi:hypothetical protein